MRVLYYLSIHDPLIIPFQILWVKKQANEGSIKSFANFSLLRSHHHGQFFRPLDPILFSATMIRRRSIALHLFSETTITSPRPHGPTIIEPRVPPPDRSSSPYLSWLDDRCVLLGYKREALPRCRHCQVSSALELDNAAALVFLSG
jgi:hypothetical protein